MATGSSNRNVGPSLRKRHSSYVIIIARHEGIQWLTYSLMYDTASGISPTHSILIFGHYSHVWSAPSSKNLYWYLAITAMSGARPPQRAYIDIWPSQPCLERALLEEPILIFGHHSHVRSAPSSKNLYWYLAITAMSGARPPRRAYIDIWPSQPCPERALLEEPILIFGHHSHVWSAPSSKSLYWYLAITAMSGARPPRRAYIDIWPSQPCPERALLEEPILIFGHHSHVWSAPSSKSLYWYLAITAMSGARPPRRAYIDIWPSQPCLERALLEEPILIFGHHSHVWSAPSSKNLYWYLAITAMSGARPPRRAYIDIWPSQPCLERALLEEPILIFGHHSHVWSAPSSKSLYWYLAITAMSGARPPRRTYIDIWPSQPCPERALLEEPILIFGHHSHVWSAPSSKSLYWYLAITAMSGARPPRRAYIDIWPSQPCPERALLEEPILIFGHHSHVWSTPSSKNLYWYLAITAMSGARPPRRAYIDIWPSQPCPERALLEEPRKQ